ncbi:MAG: multidrug ABC transporter ATP-binding protein [Flavobacteriales bacterium]|nr:MAG: multidrug ABC transporter ATP-binding protein [Flavobacteriales bacterium]
MENIIEIEHLSYGYSKNKKVLEDISLNVPKGSIYGFLGANGAGKSTTMRLLMGLHESNTEDNIKVFGQSVSKIYPEGFRRIGSLIDYPAFYSHLSGYDNLKVVCIIRDLPLSKIDETLELVGLSEAKNIKMKKYSLGMKQRLAIGLALISDPELLILDEPVNGLDPQGMVEVRELLVKLNKEKGITIFISSHLLQEIDKMVTHLGIIAEGKIKFEGSREELNQLYSYQRTKFVMENAKDFQSFVADEKIELKDESTLLIDTNSQDKIAEINTKLVENGAKIYQISSEGGLEDWFMELTKQKN